MSARESADSGAPTAIPTMDELVTAAMQTFAISEAAVIAPIGSGEDGAVEAKAAVRVAAQQFGLSAAVVGRYFAGETEHIARKRLQSALARRSSDEFAASLARLVALAREKARMRDERDRASLAQNSALARTIHELAAAKNAAPREFLELALPILQRDGLTYAEFCGRGRAAALSRARHEIWYLARKRLGWSFPQIGKICNRDHTSVLHGARRHEERLAVAALRGASAA